MQNTRESKCVSKKARLQENLESLLQKKINSVRYPMQELELNYPTTKGKVYSEEEDRYLLCRLFYYGMQADDVYELIKRNISEFPVFRFDWLKVDLPRNSSAAAIRSSACSAKKRVSLS